MIRKQQKPCSRRYRQYRAMHRLSRHHFRLLGKCVSRSQKDSAENLDKRLFDLNTRFSHMAIENEQKLENIRLTMEKKIGDLTADNNRQLEQMRMICG